MAFVSYEVILDGVDAVFVHLHFNFAAAIASTIASTLVRTGVVSVILRIPGGVVFLFLFFFFLMSLSLLLLDAALMLPFLVIVDKLPLPFLNDLDWSSLRFCAAV